MQNNEIIAHNIRLLREIRGETQKEFGKRFGSNQINIQAYESGRNRPKAEFLLILSEATGITVYDLLNKKLRKNIEGKIININEEALLQNARAEINRLTDNFEEEVIKFLKTVQKFKERINLLPQTKSSNKTA